MEPLKFSLTQQQQQLKLQRELCENNIREYENKIYQLKLNINEINFKIRNLCIEHNWKTEREPGMYGEKFTYCTKCGSNY